MKTRYKHGNFEQLPDKVREIVRELMLEAAEDRGGPEGYKQDDECIESLEFESRDGFIAASGNMGGLVYNNYTALMGYWAGGYSVAHKGAAKEIERQCELSLKHALEAFVETHKDQLKEAGFEDAAKVSYHALYEAGHGMLAEKLSEYESESLSDSESSIMHEFRFMYHGAENGVHTASVSAAVNTEGPYHRSHISWAPGVFCEGAKEVEITWKNQTELKRKLKAALSKVSKAVF